MGRNLIDRYRERLHGVLSCYDRILVTGTLPQVYPESLRSRETSCAAGRFGFVCVA